MTSSEIVVVAETSVPKPKISETEEVAVGVEVANSQLLTAPGVPPATDDSVQLLGSFELPLADFLSNVFPSPLAPQELKYVTSSIITPSGEVIFKVEVEFFKLITVSITLPLKP